VRGRDDKDETRGEPPLTSTLSPIWGEREKAYREKLPDSKGLWSGVMLIEIGAGRSVHRARLSG